MNKRNKGITLIALVITIIVLVILATVSIGMVLGNQGIFTQAEEAKKLTANAQIAEQEGFNQLYEQLTGYINGEEIEEEIKLPSTEETNPYLPGTGSTVIENSTLDNGLTVKDKNNNEWVWVEVPKSVTAKAETDIEIYTALEKYVLEYRETGWTDTWYEGCGLTEEQYNTNKTKMLNSIKSYGGFWISRYEIGTDTLRITKTDPLIKPAVSQVDKYPYNYITCSQATELCNELSPNTSVTSSLLYGIQWDLILKFIEEKATELGSTTVDRQVKIKTDSGTWGNYSNVTFNVKKGMYSENHGKIYNVITGNYEKPSNKYILLTTGVTTRNKVLNIYDLAGNEYEWTLEKSSDNSNPYVVRGGGYGNEGQNTPANSRIYITFSSSDLNFASRATLYK